MDNPISRDLVTIAVMLASLAAVYVVRKFARPEELRENNEFTGFTWAFVGLVYGVYLAFTVVVVWEHYNNADDTATNEATHLSELWRDAEILPGGKQVQDDLYAYAKSVVEDDWPAMARGSTGSAKTSAIYENLWRAYYNLHPTVTDAAQVAFYQQSLRELNQLGIQRRQRILSGSANLPAIMWFLLVTGGVVMVGFALLIGTPHAWLQYIITALLAGFLAFSIAIVGALEEPYSGDVSVRPDGFVSVIKSFEVRRAAEPPMK
jgi:hypothetical protein